MIEIAIYDMDRTITRTGTYTPFLIHAAARIAPWRLVMAPLVPLVMATYAAKLIDRRRLKEIVQRLLLGGAVPRARLAPATESFAALTVKANLHPGALRQIAEDKAAGRRLVLATASNRFYVEPIAAKLGFDDVIATGSAMGLDDIIRAKIDGENNYGPAKLRLIQAWCAEQGIDRSAVRVRFYSDHVSDAPVLEWADEPFAVNASKKLRHLAKRRGWPLLDWGL
ncbi:HAD superfamily hydrolase (TIGR01490 family) [Sphingomonas vulcanisoli]|uniref:HAD superfamily hydrolase (TIGR01490 family) n=1 Tax=Sphingomonas vulcanisoli TaxID=1658060 RepID=A0ABX0TPI9_9SPHN|nr:HAD-IB family hydrolase [Sphingomonas vulcanisoli]NIJ07449.1 HAD superfamily hydrolase (TIGR01490 family) [Sphingomonas vulcanisoli]